MLPSGDAADDARGEFEGAREGDPFESTRMPFGDHLEELRSCVIRALLGVGAGTLIAFLFAKHILTLIFEPLVVVLHAHGERAELLAMSPGAPFFLYMKVGFLTGVILSAPWVLYQMWTFVASGLYPLERRFVKRLIPASTGLFAVGVGFLFVLVLPIVLNFFVVFNQGFDLPGLAPGGIQQLLLGLSEEQSGAGASSAAAELRVPVLDERPTNPSIGAVWYDQRSRTLEVETANGTMSLAMRPASRHQAISAQYGLQEYVSFVLMLMLAFGIAFQLPIVVVFLATTGLVSPDRMAGARRYIVFGIVVAAAVLTPPDIISQFMLAVPMYALFEGGLFFARRMGGGSRAAGPT